MLDTFEYINNIWEKRELKCYLCELSYVAKKETMNSTDSTLDEIKSSFLHGYLSVKR